MFKNKLSIVGICLAVVGAIVEGIAGIQDKKEMTKEITENVINMVKNGELKI